MDVTEVSKAGLARDQRVLLSGANSVGMNSMTLTTSECGAMEIRRTGTRHDRQAQRCTSPSVQTDLFSFRWYPFSRHSSFPSAFGPFALLYGCLRFNGSFPNLCMMQSQLVVYVLMGIGSGNPAPVVTGQYKTWFPRSTFCLYGRHRLVVCAGYMSSIFVSEMIA